MKTWQRIFGVPKERQQAGVEPEKGIQRCDYVAADDDTIEAIDKSDLIPWRIDASGRQWYVRRPKQ